MTKTRSPTEKANFLEDKNVWKTNQNKSKSINESFCTPDGMDIATGVIERVAVGMLLDPTTVVDRNRKGKNDLRSVVA